MQLFPAHPSLLGANVIVEVELPDVDDELFNDEPTLMLDVDPKLIEELVPEETV